MINAGGQIASTGSGVNNVLGNITLYGGTLITGSGYSAAYESYEFGGTVTVATSPSIIAAGPGNSYSGINLGINTSAGYQTTFNVGSTGGPGPDLTVSAALGNAANSQNASGLNKTGAGLMALGGVNTYSSTTTISSGTLEISGGGQLGSGTYAGAISNSGALLYNSSAAQTFSGVISSTGALTQAGPGTLALTGTDIYTGLTSVNGGILCSPSPTPAPTSNIINNTADSSTLALGGGTLAVLGKGSTNNSQQFNGLTVNAGASSLQAVSGSSGTAGVALGAITRNVGGTVNFLLPSSGSITTTTANANFTGGQRHHPGRLRHRRRNHVGGRLRQYPLLYHRPAHRFLRDGLHRGQGRRLPDRHNGGHRRHL